MSTRPPERSVTPAHGTRYPAHIALEARRLREEGWPYRTIRKLLAERHGVQPSHSTLAWWCDDEIRTRKLAREYAIRDQQRAAAAVFRLPGKTPEYRRQFARALRAEGVPVPSIAKVFRVVYGPDWTRDRVVTLLTEGALA